MVCLNNPAVNGPLQTARERGFMRVTIRPSSLPACCARLKTGNSGREKKRDTSRMPAAHTRGLKPIPDCLIPSKSSN